MDKLKILVYALLALSLVFAWESTLYSLIALLPAGLVVSKKIKKYDADWARKVSYVWVVFFVLSLVLPVVRANLLLSAISRNFAASPA